MIHGGAAIRAGLGGTDVQVNVTSTKLKRTEHLEPTGSLRACVARSARRAIGWRNKKATDKVPHLHEKLVASRYGRRGGPSDDKLTRTVCIGYRAQERHDLIGVSA